MRASLPDKDDITMAQKTLDIFQAQQQILERIEAFLKMGEGAGIDIDPNLFEKLQKTKEIIDGPLKVALIGGVSEGKTAIVEAWTENTNLSTKISWQESSDEVNFYKLAEDFVLVDTPGLYGYKEKVSDTGKIEKYREITEKYVSEVHLVLYVMEPFNPIKASHQDELDWLFRDLKLLPRTIFVLNRFDKEINIDDQEEYQEALESKRGDVEKSLRNLINLNEREVAALSIVAVAAWPNKKRFDCWENKAEYNALSRIDLLQKATEEKIKNSDRQELIRDTQRTVIADLLQKSVPLAQKANQQISEELSRLSDVKEKITKDLLVVKREIDEAKIAIRAYVNRHFPDLIVQAEGCDMETFSAFYERNIGSEGSVLEANLQNQFEAHTGAVDLAIEKMCVSLNQEVKHFNSVALKWSKKGVKTLSASGINNRTVLAVRNAVRSVGKQVGFKLPLRFKPYGAVKLAKGINGALAALGLALEAW